MSMKSSDVQQIPIDKLSLNVENLYPYMGYHNGKTPREDILCLAKQLINEVLLIGKPLFGYQVVKGQPSGPKSVEWNGVSFHPGAIITNAMKSCEEYIFLVATVGKDVDEWIKDINVSGDIMKMYIADMIGSALTELSADYAYNYLQAIFKEENFNLTNSYSPGYCDWNVSEQHLFFSLLPPSFCGIHLSESSLMSPIKSTSCVIGAGHEVTKSPYRCDVCQKKDCFLKIARAKGIK